MFSLLASVIVQNPVGIVSSFGQTLGRSSRMDFFFFFCPGTTHFRPFRPQNLDIYEPWQFVSWLNGYKKKYILLQEASSVRVKHFASWRTPGQTLRAPVIRIPGGQDGKSIVLSTGITLTFTGIYSGFSDFNWNCTFTLLDLPESPSSSPGGVPVWGSVTGHRPGNGRRVMGVM